jgi:hypothetical protein|tara:strand:+ start:3951 stop:4100 length:150 start_codon:yes stop_codon:yes gene_type:complete
MTIKYLAGRKIQGLSSDTKPTNIQAGTVFDELDTHKSYIRHSSAWVQLT